MKKGKHLPDDDDDDDDDNNDDDIKAHAKYLHKAQTQK